jgi:hypothetical protein
MMHRYSQGLFQQHWSLTAVSETGNQSSRFPSIPAAGFAAPRQGLLERESGDAVEEVD